MKSVTIIGERRSATGKAATKLVRYAGQVPCVLYGGKDHVHFTVYSADLKDLIYTPNTVLADVSIDGNVIKAQVKDVQYHPVSDAIEHVDFVELVEGKPVTIDVPIRIVGNAPGVRAGGKLNNRMRKMRVKGMVNALPDFIEVNIEKLEIGQSIRVKDISIESIQLLDSPQNTITAVEVTRATAAETKEAAKTVAPAAAAPAAAAPAKKDDKKK